MYLYFHWLYKLRIPVNLNTIFRTFNVSSPDTSASSNRLRRPSYNPLNSPRRECICPLRAPSIGKDSAIFETKREISTTLHYNIIAEYSVSFPALTNGNRYHSTARVLKLPHDWTKGKSHEIVIQPYCLYFLCYCLGHEHMFHWKLHQLNIKFQRIIIDYTKTMIKRSWNLCFKTILPRTYQENRE